MGLISFAGAVMSIAGLCAALCLASAQAADTAPYPNRPLRFVVPFPPSGTNGIIARALVPRLTEEQIGHLAEALELLIGKLRLLENPDISQSEKDTLTVFLGDVAAIRKLKEEHS
jgi:hypothetical protein